MSSDSRSDTEDEPRIGEEQLEALQALAEFEDVELRALRELAQDRASEYVNRRSLIKGAGALAGMSVAGGVGYNEGVEQAQASASTSDSDGDVGTPSNPVDVFADGVSAGKINSTDKGVYVSDGGLWEFYDVQDYTDLGACFNAAKTTHGLVDVTYNVAPGDYGTVSTSFDLTAGGSVSAVVDISGVAFTAAMAGDPVFDFSTSHNYLVLLAHGAKVTGDATDTPSCALLFARPSGGGSAGQHRVHGGMFDGSYTAATYYNIGGANIHLNGTQLYAQGGTARATVWIGNENPESVTSPHRTIGTGQADNGRFRDCDYVGEAAPTTIELGADTNNTEFHGGTVVAGTASFARFKADTAAITDGSSFRDLYGESANTTPAAVVDITAPGTGDNAVTGMVFKNLEIGDSEAGEFLTVPANVYLDSWDVGSRGGQNTMRVPTGVTIEGSRSPAIQWSFFNLQEVGAFSNPNGGSPQRCQFVGPDSNLPAESYHNIILDADNDLISGGNPTTRIYLGNRTATPHTASGSGDVYIDTSVNPPKWKIDDPTDSAWENM